ncbi:hypothetical protein JNW90_10495 [Micromonospora sp. STR1s_5]|nr:hypothetical protein [Micromonospora sp. STR1s_5]
MSQAGQGHLLRAATGLDAPCGTCTCPGGVRACHRQLMEWGQKVPGPCRHCDCTRHTPGRARTPDPTPEVLDEQHRWACRACGARYGRNYTDHPCGPLTPVTVTITVREVVPAQ